MFYVAYQKKKNNHKKYGKTVADIMRGIFNVVHNEKDGAIKISFKIFLFRYYTQIIIIYSVSVQLHEFSQ